MRHDALAAEWEALCVPAFSRPRVVAEPIIQRAADTMEENRQTRNAPPTEHPILLPETGPTKPAALRGDVSVSGFWSRGQQTIFDITVSDVDAPSYGGRSAERVLAEREKQKRTKYEKTCRETRREFTPLAFGVDGSMGCATNAAIRRLASALASKGHRPYSEMCGFVRSRLSITLVRAAHVCLRGARESQAKPTRPYFESSAGYSLYR